LLRIPRCRHPLHRHDQPDASLNPSAHIPAQSTCLVQLHRIFLQARSSSSSGISPQDLWSGTAVLPRHVTSHREVAPDDLSDTPVPVSSLPAETPRTAGKAVFNLSPPHTSMQIAGKPSKNSTTP
jgi:hypothetical protein